jgi:hypothetical protein
MNKNNNIISLALNLTNKSCKILRAGKGLYSYINNNLFDLFPLIFKQYQINLFMSCILENFESNIKKGTLILIGVLHLTGRIKNQAKDLVIKL